jgi:hypothetical protein
VDDWLDRRDALFFGSDADFAQREFGIAAREMRSRMVGLLGEDFAVAALDPDADNLIEVVASDALARNLPLEVPPRQQGTIQLTPAFAFGDPLRDAT